jgi:hypothetical protein
MNARGFRSMSVTLLLLGASVAIMAASVTGLQVTARRELTIAIVDGKGIASDIATINASVAGALHSALNVACGGDMAIRSVVVSARDAKLKLNGGIYDAALIIGNDRPFSLRRLDLITLAGAMPGSSGMQPVYLVMGNGDPILTQRLREAFARLLVASNGPTHLNLSDLVGQDGRLASADR